MAALDLRTRSSTLPSISRRLAKRWPNGLPRRVRIGAAGGSVILIKSTADGAVRDSRWGGSTLTWENGWSLPTWNDELRCGYDMARKGASTAEIGKTCRRRR